MHLKRHTLYSMMKFNKKILIITPQSHKVQDTNSQLSQNAMKFVNRNLNFFTKEMLPWKHLRNFRFLMFDSVFYQ